MKWCKILLLMVSVFVSACVHQDSSKATDDYVEISNPFATSSPGAAPTIWVPRSEADPLVPRATDLVKKVADKVTGSLQASDNTTASLAAGAPEHAVSASNLLKKRIAVLEVKENGLQLPLSNRLEGSGILLDQHQPAFLAKRSELLEMADLSAASRRLQREFDSDVSIFISAPDLIAPGKTILGALYDGFSGDLVRTVEVQIQPYNITDPAAQKGALGVALDEMAVKLKAVAALLPWHGSVVSVQGDRVYLDAGREAGLALGQKIKVYRGGKVIPGVGFTPGEPVATVVINGFVGANSAYGKIKDGNVVQAKDLIVVE